MLSFWEKEYLLQSDVIIAGAGITGLSTACTIKENHPEVSVTVVERGILPTGASTKNAGFACIGSLSEKMHDMELMGESAFLQLISDRWEGLQILRNRLGDNRIGYQHNGGYELLLKDEKIEQEALDQMNLLLRPLFKKDIFHFRQDKIAEFGFKDVSGLILNEVEGQLNTGMMMRSLWEYTSSLGVKIMSGAHVTRFEESNQGVEVYLGNPDFVLKSERFIICTNAFTGDLLPNEEISPGRGQVLITSPIEDLTLKGVFSMDEGYYYFRNLDNRILFGGGRNLDFEAETTTAIELNPAIQQKLENLLREVIVPGKSFEVTDRWSGIMAFGKNKLPLVKKISDRVYLGARLNGMGIALGSRIAAQLYRLSFGGLPFE